MRRFLLFVVVVALVVSALYKWKEDRATARGTRPSAEKFTPATVPKLDTDDVQLLSRLDAEYTKLIDAVIPSVVSVTTERYIRMIPRSPFFFFFDVPRRGVLPGLGSGVIVSREGHVLTNYHVVKDVDKVKVQLNDGRIRDARIVSADPELDIAVLKVDAGDVTPLPFGDSDTVRVGQIVFAVGSPFGLDETVTSGIISAIGRRATSDTGNEYLQTNADINPGNSGGPLVNLRGEIIGINTMIYSQSGGSQGIGFAIPANVARRAMESLIATGQVKRGYLGIEMQTLTPDLAGQFKVAAGALVANVGEATPAAKAGLQRGDVIISVAGRRVADAAALRSVIQQTNPGTTVPVTYVREGREKETQVTLGEAPQNYIIGGAGPQTPPAPGGNNPLQGVTVVEIPEAHRSALPDGVEGVMVARVTSRSPAAEALQPGDVIEEVNRNPVASVEAYQEIVGQLQPGDRVLVSVLRGGNRSFVVVP